MLYEATRSFAVRPVPVRTPLAPARGFQLQREVVLVPVCGPDSGCSTPTAASRTGRLHWVEAGRNHAARQLLSQEPAAGFETLRGHPTPMSATGGSTVAAMATTVLPPVASMGSIRMTPRFYAVGQALVIEVGAQRGASSRFNPMNPTRA